MRSAVRGIFIGAAVVAMLGVCGVVVYSWSEPVRFGIPDSIFW